MQKEQLLNEEEIILITNIFLTNEGWVDVIPCNLRKTTWRFRSNTGELYLKTNFLRNQLIISSLEFSRPREGYGTRLLSILIQVAKRNNLTTIVAESVVSVEAREFCLKNGFTPEEIFGLLKIVKEKHGEDYLDRNYILNLGVS